MWKKLLIILAAMFVTIGIFAQNIDAKKFSLTSSKSWGMTSEQMIKTNGQAWHIVWLQWGKENINIHCFIYKINKNFLKRYDFYNDRLVGIEYNINGDSVNERVIQTAAIFGSPDVQIEDMKTNAWILLSDNTIFMIAYDSSLTGGGYSGYTGVICFSVDIFKKIFPNSQKL